MDQRYEKVNIAWYLWIFVLLYSCHKNTTMNEHYENNLVLNQMSVKLVRSAISLNEIAWHGFSPLFYLSPQKPITHLVTYQLFKAEYFSFSSSSPYWR